MKKNRLIFNFIFFFGTTLLLNSCLSYSFLPIEVIKPADYSFAPNILSVLVVDNSYIFKDDSAHTTNLFGQKGYMEPRAVEKFGLFAAEGLGNALDEKRFFDSVFVHPTALNRPVDNIPEPDLTLELIDSLLNNYNAQAIISLEDYRFFTNVDAFDVEGSYYLTLDAFATAYWKIYDYEGYILSSFVQSDSIFWDTFTEKNGDKELYVPDLKDALETLANYMGSEFTPKISPVWEKERRIIFTRGHHLFSRANDLMQINHWSEAAKVWYYVFENGTKLQKAVAAYNIAVSYEMRNDFEEAVAWANISKEKFGKVKSWQINKQISHFSDDYINILENRKSDSEKLNEQLGGAL